MVIVKKLLFIFSFLFVLFLTFLAVIPAFLSTEYGKNTSVNFLQKLTLTKIELKELSIGWFSGVHLKGLNIHDAQGKPFFECKEIHAEKPLIKWLYSWYNVGDVKISSPTLFLPQGSPPVITENSEKKKFKKEHHTTKQEKSFIIPPLQGSLFVDQATIVAPSTTKAPVTLSDGSVKVSVDLADSSKGDIQFNLSQQGQEPIPLFLSFSMDGNPFESGKASFCATAEKVPTKLIAAITETFDAKLGDILSESLGTSFSYHLNGSSAEGKTVVKSSLSSGNFSSDIDISLVNNILSLKEGPLFKGTLTPALCKALGKMADQKQISILQNSSFVLENKSTIKYDVSQHEFLSPFAINFATKEPLFLKISDEKSPLILSVSAELQGSAEKKNIVIALSANNPLEVFAQFELTAVTKNGEYPTTTSLVFSGSWPKIAERFLSMPIASYLGEDTRVEIIGQGSYNMEKMVASLHEMHIKSAILSGEIRDFTIEKDCFSLSSPAALSITLNDKIFPQIKKSLFKFEVAPFSLTKKNDLLSGNPISIQTKGSLTIAQSGDSLELNLPVQLDLVKKSMLVSTHLSKGSENFIKGNTTVDFSSKAPGIEGDIFVQDFPVTLVEQFSNQKIAELVGKRISAKIGYVFSGLEEKGNHFSIDSHGDFWNVDADVRLDNEILSLGKSGLHAEATLTPEYIKNLQVLFQKKNDLSFRKPLTIRASLPLFQLSMSPLLHDSEFCVAKLFDTLKLRAVLSIPETEIVQGEVEVARVAPLIGELEIDGAKQRTEFSLTPEKSSKGTSPEVALSLKDYMDKKSISLEKASLSATFKVNSLPMRLVDFAAPGKGTLAEEVLGKTCTIQGVFSTKSMESGAIQFDVKAEHANAHVDGSIKNGNITLNSPARVSLELTKNAGTLLLKDVNPLLASAVHSEKPITITIDPKNVLIPFRAFSLNTLILPKVTVDMGKIVVKNGGALKIILALLKQGKAANSEELNVWLTPLYLQVQNGLVTCLRSDALVADELHFISWGTADLVRDNLDMTIAIPQETLQRVGLQISSPSPERGLQIPIRGPSSNPKIETARATAKLAGAGAMKVSGDDRIRLLGGLIQAVASVGEEDKPIPAPTTSPLPWDY